MSRSRCAGREGNAERFPALLRELVRLKPDVIVVASTLGAVAAKATVTSIPVVMVAVSDPTGMKLVASLAHPGGNMTGTSREFGRGLVGKALQAVHAARAAATFARLYCLPVKANALPADIRLQPVW